MKRWPHASRNYRLQGSVRSLPTSTTIPHRDALGFGGPVLNPRRRRAPSSLPAAARLALPGNSKQRDARINI
uniref:Uncharacterized protein n=1 Tax=Oryza punctata TaxID=4537 RepID=A0A0E0L631_ORYPU